MDPARDHRRQDLSLGSPAPLGGPAEELAAREDLEHFAITTGQAYVVSFSIAERVRCLAELGRWREVVALADTVDLAEAQPRWAAVQRALALAELGSSAKRMSSWYAVLLPPATTTSGTSSARCWWKPSGRPTGSTN